MKLRWREETPAADASSSWLMRRVARHVRSMLPNAESAVASAVMRSTVGTLATAHDYQPGNRLGAAPGRRVDPMTTTATTPPDQIIDPYFAMWNEADRATRLE